MTQSGELLPPQLKYCKIEKENRKLNRKLKSKKINTQYLWQVNFFLNVRSVFVWGKFCRKSIFENTFCVRTISWNEWVNSEATFSMKLVLQAASSRKSIFPVSVFLGITFFWKSVENIFGGKVFYVFPFQNRIFNVRSFLWMLFYWGYADGEMLWWRVFRGNFLGAGKYSSSNFLVCNFPGRFLRDKFPVPGAVNYHQQALLYTKLKKKNKKKNEIK